MSTVPNPQGQPARSTAPGHDVQGHNVQFSLNIRDLLMKVLSFLHLDKSADHAELEKAVLSAAPGAGASGVIQAVLDAAKVIWKDPHTQQLAVQVLYSLMNLVVQQIVPTPAPAPTK